ncbi:hypothetical protein DPMN_049123 [Dreissena polymorpha]|uniref:Uncharacterized protein n=1 Tax=Dreissena polymorpha TaxID=45954 RepID=A0A9D4DAT3_DREPO|nr:hypothetical protein DPMN_049123 [Dreissena polymorpha]
MDWFEEMIFGSVHLLIPRTQKLESLCPMFKSMAGSCHILQPCTSMEAGKGTTLAVY